MEYLDNTPYFFQVTVDFVMRCMSNHNIEFTKLKCSHFNAYFSQSHFTTDLHRCALKQLQK